LEEVLSAQTFYGLQSGRPGSRAQFLPKNGTRSEPRFSAQKDHSLLWQLFRSPFVSVTFTKNYTSTYSITSDSDAIIAIE